jgi:biotin carboxylase
VIEFAPRVGGGLNFRLVLLKTGVDIVDATVEAYLGRTIALPAADRAGWLAACHVYAEAGSFGEVRNQERLLAEGIFDEFYLHKARGATIGASLSSSDRAASFLVHAHDPAELLGKVRTAMDRLDVVDLDGRSIIRRDICLKAL